jgi:hypothetical protein
MVAKGKGKGNGRILDGSDEDGRMTYILESTFPSLSPCQPALLAPPPRRTRTLFLQRHQLALQFLDSPFILHHVVTQRLSILFALLQLSFEEQGCFQSLREEW